MVKKIMLFLVICMMLFFSCKSIPSTSVKIDNQTIIKLNFYNTANAYGPWIDMTINNKKYSVLLDTGARNDGFSFSKEILSELQFVGKSTTNTLSVDGIKKKDNFIIDSVLLDKDLVLQNVICSGQNNEKNNLINSIGLKYFTNNNVFISYKESQMILFPNNQYPSDIDCYKKIKLLNNKSIDFFGTIENTDHKYKICLDTGTMSIRDNIISDGFLNKSIGISSLRNISIIINGTEYKEISLNYIMVPQIVLFFGAPDILLNYTFLINHDILIDLTNNYIYVK